MDRRCFMFDLIILNVWVNDFDYEKNSLSVGVCFLDTEFTIEQNPENPGEFKQGRTCEFPADPEELRDDLLDHPLQLKIISNEGIVLGEVELPWPDDLLSKLEKGHFGMYSHFDQCDMKVDNMNTGKIGIHYRMRVKCDYSDSEEGEEEERRGDIKSELKRIVNPNEVFFLIQNDSDLCVGNSEVKKDANYGTALDLSKFRNFHGKVVKDPGVFDQVYALDCCHTKKFITECKHGGCSGSKPPCPAYNQEPSRCEESKSSMQWACKAKKHLQECPHSNKFSDETTGSCSCLCADEDAEPQTNIFNNGKMKNICGYPKSPPVLKEDVYIRPRLCPVCNNDVSWLPKLAACTKCGHKPTPYAIERPYDETLTADQILEEWADENDQSRPNPEATPKKQNRCSCKNGKICAFCRIRKLCKDVVKSKKCLNPRSEDSVMSVKESVAEQTCKSNETDSRTYLAKVFSELRDLYNLKPDMNKRDLKPHKSCEKAFAAPKLKPKPKASGTKLLKPTSSNLSKQKKELAKSVTSEARAKWCRGKIYNYKTIRQYPGTLIGHKTCVASGKSVPPNMGWLWSADAGNFRGWKPGAIRKPIRDIMKFFLKDFPVDSLRVSRYSRKVLAKKEPEELIQRPTLHICKKNGVYTITMRPLKDASVLHNCADPYVEMSPIRFRIVKNPLLIHASAIKKTLKKQFQKCTCHQPVSACYCRSYLDKKRLEFELNKECRQKQVPNLKNTIVLSDTSESEDELDFGVTPPAGVIKPQIRDRSDLACHGTQYLQSDWEIKQMFPMKFNKYMKPLAGRKRSRMEPEDDDESDGECHGARRVLRGRRGRHNFARRVLPGEGKGGPPGGVGGWGAVGGNYKAFGVRGGFGTNPLPLLNDLPRRAQPSAFDYKASRTYPGVQAGHKACVSSGKSVPRNMGWLWNTDTVGNRRGWRPGAIRRSIKEIMKYFLKDLPIDSVRVSRYARKGPSKEESEEIVQKPTLHICKKNGVYIVTMRPLSDATMLRNCTDTSVKPIRFKIVKNPLLVHASSIKKQLKRQFHKCTCHKPISSCHCRTFLDKKRLEFELNKACRQKNLPSLKDTLVLSDTSDSEMEFDFGVTPPAGVIKTEIKKPPSCVCHETQYNDKDLILKPMYPMKVNKFMTPFVATGGRTRTGKVEGPSKKIGCAPCGNNSARPPIRPLRLSRPPPAGLPSGGKRPIINRKLGMMIPPPICFVPKLRKAVDPCCDDPKLYMATC